MKLCNSLVLQALLEPKPIFLGIENGGTVYKQIRKFDEE
jgi:hypothetical protein